jgi:malate dehydrogenase (oxaloacetate-decarboxylating)
MAVAPSASYSITARLSIANRPGMLGRVALAIGEAGGDIGAVDLVESGRDRVVRDITIKARDSHHGQQIVNDLKELTGVKVVNISDRTSSHLGGKIEIRSRSRCAPATICRVYARRGPRVPAIQGRPSARLPHHEAEQRGR